MSDDALVLRKIVPMLPSLVAGVSVLGEVLLLRQDLVGSYPYAMLTYPPSSSYETFANVTSPVLFAAAVFAARRFPPRHAGFAPVVLASFTPLAYLIVLFGVTAARYGFAVPDGVRNFDAYTVGRATSEFARFALLLATAGLVVGGACTMVLVRLLSQDRSPSERSEITRSR